MKLGFAAPVFTTAGKRKFNVSAEGKTVLSNFDIAASGGGRAALVRQFNVAVSDGTLNLNFIKVLDNPIVSAIEILPATVTPAPTPTATVVTGLTLVNAATDQVIGALTSGTTLDLAAIGSKLSVRADTSPGTVGSVAFTLDGQRIKLENAAPYTIAGDVGSDYLPWTPTVGTHTLVATPFTGTNATGAVGQSATVRFTVINTTPTPQPTPTPTGFTKINWTTKASSPIGRAESLSATIDGKIYVFGGFSGNLGPVTRSDVFDPGTNTWSPIADLPERTTHAGVAVDGRDVYLVGGYIGKPGQVGYDQIFGTRNVWRYNVDANAWTLFAQLPAAMAGGGAAVVGRDLHYFGGYDLSRKDVNVHLVLNLDNPAAGWRSAAKMLKTVNHLGVALLGGKVYAIAGQTGTDGGLVTQRDVQIYDPVADTWTADAAMPAARSHITGATFAMGDRILVIAGESAHGVTTRNVYAYTPATNTWAELSALPANRFSGVAGVVNGKIYYTTGGGNVTYEGAPA